MFGLNWWKKIPIKLLIEYTWRLKLLFTFFFWHLNQQVFFGNCQLQRRPSEPTVAVAVAVAGVRRPASSICVPAELSLTGERVIEKPIAYTYTVCLDSAVNPVPSLLRWLKDGSLWCSLRPNSSLARCWTRPGQMTETAVRSWRGCNCQLEFFGCRRSGRTSPTPSWLLSTAQLWSGSPLLLSRDCR